jgi:hypothetical protein
MGGMWEGIAGESKRTYGFVEEEERWVFQYDTGDGETLFLSS